MDPLTRLHNRRALERDLPELFEAQRQAERELTVVLLDINNFKKFNDTLGHQVGDQVIAFAGELVRAMIRKQTDLAVRYGGDEIVLVLPDTTATEAAAIAQRIVAMFAQRRKAFGPVQPPPGISAGIASGRQHHAESWEQLVRMADEAMYWAKRHHRDVATIDDVDIPISDTRPRDSAPPPSQEPRDTGSE
jgi:diguanylate cyclase (GGDEF)-like protein